MVEPACAAADTAISGSSSEIVRKRFVNIVRLLFIAEAHHLRFFNEFGANRRPVTCSRRREGGGRPHHYDRGPSIALAKGHSSIVRSYQTATNSNGSLE